MNLYKNTMYIMIQSERGAALPRLAATRQGHCNHTSFLVAIFHNREEKKVFSNCDVLNKSKTQMLLHESKLTDILM